MIMITKIAVIFFCIITALSIIAAIVCYIIMCCIGFPKDFTYHEIENFEKNKEEKINYLNAI